MGNFSSRREREEMQELIKAYQNLRAGRSASFLQEEDFERIIDYYDDKDDMANALNAAETGCEQFPFAAQLMYRKADVLIALQRYQEALEILDIAAAYDHTDPSLYILKTDAFMALEQTEKAARTLEEGLEMFEGDERIELLLELADVYDDYQDFQKVFECMKLILEEDPNNEEALLKICFWADFTGRSEESIKLHQWIIDEYPFNELAWFNLAAAYQGLKLYEKAIDAYQYALAIDEKLDIAYRNMGDAYIRLRRYREAIEALEHVLELCRPEDVIYEAIGHCYQKLEKFNQARVYYRKASNLNPEDSRIYYKIATTFFRQAQWDKTIKQLEHAMRIHPHNADYSLLMGDALMQVNKIKDAAQHYAQVIKAKPRNLQGHYALIRCLMAGGFYAEAHEQSLQAYQVTRQNNLFLYLATAALFASGKNKEGLLQLETALRIDPRGLKKLIDILPSVVQKPAVTELINRYAMPHRKRN